MSHPELPHPDPDQATQTAELVAFMRQLRDVSGLTYRDLERRAADLGEMLPRSTLATVLRHDLLPRPEVLRAFLVACGYDGPVDAWLAARDRIASGAHERQGPGTLDGAAGPGAGIQAGGSSEAVEADGGPGVQELAGAAGAFRTVETTGPAMAPADGGTTGGILRLRRRPWSLGAAVLAVCAVAIGGYAFQSGSGDDGPSRPGAADSSAARLATKPGLVQPGTYRIRVTGSDLCLSESVTQDSGGRVGQFDCSNSVPIYLLEPFGSDQYMIRSLHPVMGHGCLGVDSGLRSNGARLMNDYCGRRGTAERFRIRPARSGDQTYRITPVHTGACVTIPGGIGTPGAPVVQLPCSTAETGQVFTFDSVPAPTGIPDITTN
ncbi:XRE family transcriptional regulator [Streptomyces sp. NPDC002054]|uniref:RICIN domain-containing protein n=1 Tax=Streptomyces sp. NPDC002054 TaxID=3154663 RepID=UPI003325B9EE